MFLNIRLNEARTGGGTQRERIRNAAAKNSLCAVMRV